MLMQAGWPQSRIFDHGAVPAKETIHRELTVNIADAKVMSNIVKTSFGGFLRGWFRRSEKDEAEAPLPSAPSRPFTPSVPRVPPAPPVAEPAPTPPAPAPVRAVESTHGEELEMPLLVVLEKLPPELRGKMVRPVSEFAQASIFIPIATVLPQLAVGAVKIQFGTLRAAAPDLFRVGREYDDWPVPLPLNEVLRRISPKLLTRSPAQKVVTVSDQISGPFGGRAAAAPAASVVSRAVPAPHHVAVAPAPAPVASPAPVPPPAAAPLPQAPASLPAQSQKPSALAGLGAGAPAVPPLARPTPVVPSVTPKVTPAAAVTAPASGLVLAPLATLAQKWPDPMRAELAQLNLSGAEIALPLDLLTAALKRGRVIFPWRTLRAWLKPTPITTASARDNLELTLPLKIIVPLFLAKYQAPARKATALSPSGDIPNVISGVLPTPPAAAAAPTAAPLSFAPVPPASPATPVAPAAPQPPAPPAANQPAVNAVKPVDAYISQTDFYTFSDTGEAPRIDPTTVKRPPASGTDFTRRVTPREIVERARSLPGVAGAVVALPDGLPVASQVPPGADADLFAAFLPQIFERVTRSAAELQMGELDHLAFTVGGVPWAIFRAQVFRDSVVYFAAFGRTGEALPAAPLATLAAELNRKQQP